MDKKEEILQAVDFLTQPEKHTEEILHRYSVLRAAAPPTTSDFKVCKILAQQMGMHANSILYHIKNRGLYKPYSQRRRKETHPDPPCEGGRH